MRVMKCLDCPLNYDSFCLITGDYIINYDGGCRRAKKFILSQNKGELRQKLEEKLLEEEARVYYELIEML